MKIIKLNGQIYDAKPGRNFPDNKIGFAVATWQKDHLLRYMVYVWEISPRDIMKGIVASFFLKAFAFKTAEALQQAYDSGQEEFLILADPHEERHKAEAIKAQKHIKELWEKFRKSQYTEKLIHCIEKPPVGGERIKS